MIVLETDSIKVMLINTEYTVDIIGGKMGSTGAIKANLRYSRGNWVNVTNTINANDNDFAFEGLALAA